MALTSAERANSPHRVVLAVRSDCQTRVTVATLRTNPSGVVEWFTDRFERLSPAQFERGYRVLHELLLPESSEVQRDDKPG